MAAPPPAVGFASATYDWLVALDPAVFVGTEQVPEVRSGLDAVHAAAAELKGWFEANGARTGGHRRVQAAFELVLSELPAVDTLGDGRLEWLAVRERVSPLYEAFALSVKSSGGRVRHLHPTNYLRSLVHIGSGLAVVAAFQFVFTQTSAIWTALAFVVWAWSLEGARRASPAINRLCMRFFGPIARDHERYRVNSATWYGTALLVLALTAFGPAGALGLLALAVGDPAAGLVGRTYGQIRIWGGKSLEGFAAFALVSSAVGYAYLLAFQFTLAPVGVLLVLALVAGIAGATTELLSTRLEDNFTIPVVTSWVCQGALWLLT